MGFRTRYSSEVDWFTHLVYGFKFRAWCFSFQRALPTETKVESGTSHTKSVTSLDSTQVTVNFGFRVLGFRSRDASEVEWFTHLVSGLD